MKARYEAVVEYKVYNEKGHHVHTAHVEQDAINKVNGLNGHNPEVLFDSTNIKVFKFKDLKQLSEWYAGDTDKRNYISASTYDFKSPLIAFTNANGCTIVLGNITEDLISDLEDLVNIGGLV